jgi:glutamine cyclotransferase
VGRLNELEWVEGRVYANIWKKDVVAVIAPDTGTVEAWIDLSGLLTPEDRAGHRVDVLNGIAYDPATERLWVTGKKWPMLYEIALTELPAAAE